MANPLTQSIKPSGQGGDYTSLSSWESQNLDLVTLDSSSYAMIDGNWSGSSDTTAVSIDGWTTNNTCSITVECIGTGSRHSGVWDDTKYQLSSSANYCLQSKVGDLSVVGLQIKKTNTSIGSTQTAIEILQTNITSGHTLIDSCILVDEKRSNAAIICLHTQFEGSSIDRTYIFRNNVIVADGGRALYIRSNGYYTIDNCTFYGSSSTGFDIGAAGAGGTTTIIARNNSVQGTFAQDYDSVGFDASSRNNISSDTTAPGTNKITSSIVSFVDSASYDFRIADNDTVAKGNGYDLYNNSIVTWNNDIAGITRTSGSWDVGAFAYVFISGSFIPVTTFYRQYSSGFFSY